MTNLYQCVNAFKSLDSWFLLNSVQGELDNFFGWKLSLKKSWIFQVVIVEQ